jgi:hypothetical protein
MCYYAAVERRPRAVTVCAERGGEVYGYLVFGVEAGLPESMAWMRGLILNSNLQSSQVVCAFSVAAYIDSADVFSVFDPISIDFRFPISHL